MIGSMFLSPNELVELTGRRKRDSQAQTLRAMGIEHKVRADGKVVVLRRHVEQELGAHGRAAEVEAMPDWSAA
ncbi:DUF4224 domain-containing protein [Paraburkholderia strydomiana]|jgi:hypothetical protein|uniref:DUF4224 domain-containing protein n=1 Tax=Paraburkholderia strydomiana TaxID=1245417 RepID=UPI0038BCCA85